MGVAFSTTRAPVLIVRRLEFPVYSFGTPDIMFKKDF